ncbi:MAG: type II 3-dehydroquinate dehydratase [Clostridia bacterium]|nr:type II 3-dehydroquinate dehydratase [Clostridia bacterium]
MRILVLNGPNMNLLGIREKDIYGESSYRELCRMIERKADELNVYVDMYQSNHEGDLVDKIQETYKGTDGIIINPAAYTHTSIAILDALKTVKKPTVEVHITDISEREDFRKLSYVSMYAEKTIMGKGFDGYIEALEYLVEKLSAQEAEEAKKREEEREKERAAREGEQA